MKVALTPHCKDTYVCHFPPSESFAHLRVAVALVNGALFAGVAVSSAAGPIKLGLTPIGETGSNFTLTMQPGESRNLAVQLVNRGTESVLTRSFAADAYSIVNGGFAVRLDGEPTSGTTTWLSYPTEDVDLSPVHRLSVISRSPCRLPRSQGNT